jgi:hypothetical protein
MHIMKQGMQLLVTRLSWILRVQCFAEVMQEKYERWRGIDKADFDNIYLWSIEMYGDDDE